MIAVVLVLTVAFLALYALGTDVAFDEVDELGVESRLDERVLTGSTLLGLAMFTTLFLGAVLAAFLTLGAARRRRAGPCSRWWCGRWVARAPAGSVCGGGRGLRALRGGRVPRLAADHRADGRLVAGQVLAPGLGLVAGVLVIAAMSRCWARCSCPRPPTE